MDIAFWMLSGGAILLVTGAATFLGLWVHGTVLGGFLDELRQDADGRVLGVGSIAIRRLGAVNRSLIWPAFEAKMRRRLVKAGEPRGYAPEDILAMQEVGAVIGLIVGLLVANLLNQNLAWGLLGALAGGAYPLIWVNDQIIKRHLQITRALPYSLDLLTLSVEAGMDFTAALSKVVEKGKPGPLREEMQLVLKQLKMGKTREEALKSLIVRVDLPPLTTFVTALVQADKMGTSLGKVLRIQSTQMRMDRTQRAEKLANEAPVKMLFPLIACIFPTVFMILFGPIVFALIFGNVTG